MYPATLLSDLGHRTYSSLSAMSVGAREAATSTHTSKENFSSGEDGFLILTNICSRNDN